MRRLLLDVNVVLDVLLNREPHAAASAEVWAMVERGRVEGLVPAHGFTTIHYLAERARDREFANGVVVDLLAVFSVAAEDAAVLRDAVRLGWKDFEDAVTAAAAMGSECDGIVTRDPAGFEEEILPLFSPDAALAWLSTEPSE